MLSKLDLNGTWKARGFDFQHGSPEGYLGPGANERVFIDARVPGDIHLDLQNVGLVGDPNIGLEAQNQRWVEEQIWVYRRTFAAPAEALAKRAWLVFDALDLAADVYLNGEKIGSHANVFLPCRIDVSGKLKDGENTLAVRIDSGLYSVADKPSQPYNPGMDHKLHKRAWLRKPQCQFSWDWAPRLVNVGIPRGVRLEWTDSARIDALTVYPVLSDDLKSARIEVRAFVENVKEEPTKAVIRVRVPEAGQVIEKAVELPAGVSRQDVSVEIPDPKLWWPRPHGDQPLYTVECEIEINGDIADSAKRRTGLRNVKINQNPHPATGRYFIIEVNGKPIFAKGGNWVPPDTIYATIEPDRIRKLVDLAVEANFNCLRIWGGGLYADHALLEACDEAGIMVWHDFIFACSKYPGDDPEFLGNVRKEIEYQVRDLSPYPSLVVWCGNNELEWAAWEWGYDRDHAHPDYALYHLEIPRIVAREDPSRPYWPSSPYSLDNVNPKDLTTGDQHPWNVSLGAGGTDFWLYRADVSRFPNEGGVLGATGMATLRQALPADQLHLFSPAWEFHDNACNYWQGAGVCYRAMEDWLGLTPDDVPFPEYVYLSGLLQCEGLGEYINNYRRRMYSSASAIFWMYNDTWPQSHGWTIVDYYLRRKLAYHPVRRAFAPITVVPAVEGDKIVIFGINDTEQSWAGEVRFGLFNLAGGLPIDKATAVTLPPNASTVIGEVALSELESRGVENAGAFALLIKNGVTIAQNRLFTARFKDLKWADSEIRVERRGEKVAFSCNTFAWGVCLDPDCDSPVPDDLFDLLPGIAYEIEWPSDRPLPEVRRKGS
jgi:beta-mannosidase